MGGSYDNQSVMHYDRLAFTKKGKPTIVAIGNAENVEFGTPNNLLSTRDAVEINALYNCRSELLCSKVPHFVLLAHVEVHKQRGVLLEGPGL